MDIDLSQPPADSNAARGYNDLYRLWKSNNDTFAEGRDFPPAKFDEWVRQVGEHLDQREIRFFTKPFPAEIPSIPELLQAKAGARLHIILMDRHGVKVSKEGGGLGLLHET